MSEHFHSEHMIRAAAFRALHERQGIFVVPNPWDAGSASLLAGLGFEALATSSAGLAFSLGKPDGKGAVTREETLANARAIVAATVLPVAADLENGYGDEPSACAETIIQASHSGLAGGSIEDATGNAVDPIYAFDHAVDRIRAAVAAARSLSIPFTLTARAENLIYGRDDLQDTLRRLEAFADAGADVLFAPGLKTKEQIRMAVSAVSPKPLSVLITGDLAGISVREFEDLGVKRLSLGSALARLAYGSFYRSATTVRQKGTFQWMTDTMGYDQFNALFDQP